MPKNKGKGGKTFRKGKKDMSQTNYRPLRIRQEKMGGKDMIIEMYAMVVDICGNGRFRLKLISHDSRNGKEVMGTISGKMRRRVWINKDDLVLVIKDDESKHNEVVNEGVVIVHKYDMDDERRLRDREEIPADVISNKKSNRVLDDDVDEVVVFKAMRDDSDEDNDENSDNKEEDIDIDDL